MENLIAGYLKHRQAPCYRLFHAPVFFFPDTGISQQMTIQSFILIKQDETGNTGIIPFESE